MAKHIVLVGGGHAHAQVIKAMAARPANVKVTLVDPLRRAVYSGMVPGCVSGLYGVADTEIALEPVASWASVDYLSASVTDVDPLERTVTCDDGSVLRYDALSLDIGSTVRTMEGVGRWTIPTRPIGALVERFNIEEAALRADVDIGARVLRIAIVGGGAAGIEMAFATIARFAKVGAAKVEVTLLDSGVELLPNEAAACRAAVNEALEKKGVAVQHGFVVESVSEGVVASADGRSEKFTHCVWATGAASHELAKRLAAAGVPVTERGWIRVKDTLQSVAYESLFAAGDCASIEGLDGPPPKAGVYAVRAGPILIQNLTASIAGGALQHYAPQSDFLKLLMTGDGSAIGFRFGKAMTGAWVWHLKDLIDRSFMDLFAAEGLGSPPERGAALDTAQYDAVELPPRLEPEDSATLLGRTDEGVDYKAAFAVLKHMMADADYKTAVLAHMP